MPANKKPITVQVDGKQMVFQSHKAACDHFGVNAALFACRKLAGWTIEESLEIEERDRSHSQNKPIKFTHNKRRYSFPSHKDAALHFNVNPRLFRHKLTVRGWSVRQALGLVKPPRRKQAHNVHSVVVVNNGRAITYSSLPAVCRLYKKPYHLTFQKIKKRGFTVEQALGIEPPPLTAKKDRGEIYLLTHIESGMKYVGQTIQTIATRLRGHLDQAQDGRKSPMHKIIAKEGLDGFSVERLDSAKNRHELNEKEQYWIKTLNTEWPNGFNMDSGGRVGPLKGTAYVIDGVTYDSLAHLARSFGFLRETLAHRIEHQGMTIEEAINCEKNPNHKKIVVRGNSYESLAAACTAHDADYQMVFKRIEVGWDAERAILEPKTKGTQVVCHGVVFDSISALAKHYGMPYSKVSQRIRKFGWSPEDAVEKHDGRSAKPIRFTHKGKKYSYRNLDHACDTHGIEKHTVRYRRNKKKWSWPKALGITDKGKKAR